MNYYISIPAHNKFYSTAPSKSHTGVVMQPLAQFPSGTSQALNIEEFRTSIGSMKIKLINKECEISKYIYQTVNSKTLKFYREKAEIYAFDNNRYYLIFTGIITDFNPDEYETVFEITISDFQNELKKSLFYREFSSFSTETIEEISNRLPAGFLITTYVDEDDFTQRKITFTGHPIDFVISAFKILYYDISEDGSINYLGDSYLDFVDEQNLNDVKQKLGDINFYFEFKEKIKDPFEFFRTQIYKATGCYPIIKNDGKFKLKLHEQPTLEEVQVLENNQSIVLNEKNIIKTDKNNGGKFSAIINHLIISYQYDFEEEKYMKKEYYYNSPSVSKHKKLLPDNPLEIELMGLNNMTEEQRTNFITNLKDRIFSRFSDCPKEIKISAFFEDNGLEVGNYITLSHSKICEWKTGNVGERGIEGVDIEDPDNVINLNAFDEWGGYLDSANPGVFDGETILIVEQEIKVEFFQSIASHHTTLDNYLSTQGY